MAFERLCCVSLVSGRISGVVTARHAESDVVVGLESGSEDN